MRRLMLPEIPDLYQRLEFIANPNGGYAFINTGVTGANFTKVYIKMANLVYNNANYRGVFGCRVTSGNSAKALLIYNNKFYINYGNNYDKTTNIEATVGKTFEITMNNGVYNINGNVIDTGGGVVSNDYSCYLCDLNSKFSVKRSYIAVYRFKLYNGDKLVRDYIPCKHKKTGIIGMWEKVQGNFVPSSKDESSFVGPDSITLTTDADAEIVSEI